MMILAVLLFLQDSPDVDRLARERAYDAKQRAALIGDGWPNTHLSDWVIYNPGLRVSVSGRVMGSDTVLHTYCENRLVQRDDGSSRLGTVSFDEIRVTTPDETALPLILCARCSPRDILVTGHRGPFKVSMKGTQTWFSRYDLCFESPRQGDTQYVGDMTVSVEWPRVRIKSASGWWESARPICFEFFTFELIP